MNLIPRLNPSDASRDLNSLSLFGKLSQTLAAEKYVFLLVLEYLTCIASTIVFYPFQILFNIKKWQDPNYKYAFFQLISMVFATFLFSIYNSEWLGNNEDQPIHLLSFVIIAVQLKCRQNTHQRLRGSARENKQLLSSLFLHICIEYELAAHYFDLVRIYLFEQLEPLNTFSLSLFNLQICFSKQSPWKILDEQPEYQLPVKRLIALNAIAYRLCTSKDYLEDAAMIFCFQLFFELFNLELISLTKDSVNLVTTLKNGLRWVTYQFVHNDADADDTILMNFPIEPFVVLTIHLLIVSPKKNAIILGSLILAFAFIGPLIIKFFCPPSVEDIINERKEAISNKEKTD